MHIGNLHWYGCTLQNERCRKFLFSDVGNGCNRPIYQGVGNFLPHRRLVCYIRCLRLNPKNSDMALFAVHSTPRDQADNSPLGYSYILPSTCLFHQINVMFLMEMNIHIFSRYVSTSTLLHGFTTVNSDAETLIR